MLYLYYLEVGGDYMPRHTIYLSEEQDRFVKSMKERFGSISEVIQVGLKRFQQEELKEYYQQKGQQYSELRKAQKKVLKRL